MQGNIHVCLKKWASLRRRETFSHLPLSTATRHIFLTAVSGSAMLAKVPGLGHQLYLLLVAASDENTSELQIYGTSKMNEYISTPGLENLSISTG